MKKSGKQNKAPAKNDLKSDIKSENSLWYILVLVIAITIAYLPVFNAGFVNWDDEDYVLNNSSIQSLTNFHEIITQPVQGNYHPLTMYSLAINFAMSGKDASSYHLFNLILHILNSILVFLFVWRLGGFGIRMAFIIALLFGIHPLHVESVAWISERKDVLYSLFFLSGMIVYLRYLESKKVRSLLVVFLLFVLSLLSKPAAVIFPLVLLSLDYFKNRLGQAKTYLEKLPFLLLSVLAGLLSMQGQKSAGSTVFAEAFTFFERMIFACYGIVMYAVKTLVPLSLCAFYPFPDPSSTFPISYYIAPVFALFVLLVLAKYFRSHKLITLSILFYVLNLLLVIQLIPVGNAVIADRYAYLPLLGLLMLVGYFYRKWLIGNNGKTNYLAAFTLVIVCIVLMRLTYTQAATWKSGASLWDQALKVAPSSRAYVNRGLLYKRAGNTEQAFENYSAAIALSNREPDAWVNRGNIYFANKEFKNAIEDYNHCIALNPTNVKAYENRGSAFASTGEPEKALADFNMALSLDSNSHSSYANKAMLMMSKGNYGDAIDNFQSYLKIQKDPNPEIWNFMGEANFRLDKFEEALNCYDEALKIKQTSLYYLNRSKILWQLNRKQEARVDALKSIEMGQGVDPEYLKNLGINPSENVERK